MLQNGWFWVSHKKVGNETNVLLSFLTYSVFHRFKQAKFAYAGLVLSSRSQFFAIAPAVSKNDACYKSA